MRKLMRAVGKDLEGGDQVYDGPASHSDEDPDIYTDELLQFASGCNQIRCVKIATRKIVTTQGESIRSIFLIRSGCVRTFYLYADGRSITLAYWTAGMMIGLPGVSRAGQTYLWSSETVEATDLLQIPVEQFQSWIATRPGIQRQVVALLELKVRHLSSITQMLAAPSTVSRLGLVLENLCWMHGQAINGGTFIKIRLTHADIADMVGASRQWVTRTLIDLRRAGIIDCRHHQLTVLRRDLLPALGTILE